MKKNKIKIIFNTGVVIHIGRLDLFRLMHEPVVISFFILGGLAAAHISPLAIGEYVSPTFYFVLIVIKALAALFILHAVFLGLHLITSYAKNLPLFSVVAMLTTAIMLEIVWLLGLHLFLDPGLIPEPDFWGADLLTSFVTLTLGEVIYSMFVLRMTAWWQEDETKAHLVPAVAAPLPAPVPMSPRPPEPPELPEPGSEPIKSIMIGKEFLVLRELMYLKAEQHYVQFVTDNRSFMHRARFEDTIDLLPEALGTRTHRSFWVAWDAISDVSVFKDGRGEILLATGDRLPISRSYRKKIVDHFSTRG